MAPRLLRAVRAEPDSFLIVAVSIALVTAGVGALAFDVPVALAAFVAALALSLRDEAAEARREVLAFRELFAVLFFVAVGSLVDPAQLPGNLAWVGLALVLTKGLLSATLAHPRARCGAPRSARRRPGADRRVQLRGARPEGSRRGRQRGPVHGSARCCAVSIALSTVAVRVFPARQKPD